MSYIDWSDTLSIRVPEMDNQHKILVKMLNDLHDAMKAGNGRSVIGPIISKLVSYTKTHLANEEKFLESINYAFLNSHKTEHRKLTEQVLELQAKYNSGDMSVAPKLMTFLRDWLVGHIQKVDRMYGDYYNKQLASKSAAKTTA
jgi:hemerythrin